jgi:hypothetical protein
LFMHKQPNDREPVWSAKANLNCWTQTVRQNESDEPPKRPARQNSNWRSGFFHTECSSTPFS